MKGGGFVTEPFTEGIDENIRQEYFGKYRGFVTDNEDPDRLGRLKLIVPSLLETSELEWALPCMPFGGLPEYGFFMIPEVGAQVWVEFEQGNLAYPIWTGTFWQPESEVPEEISSDGPTARLIKTPSGHILHMEDKEDEEIIHLKHMIGSELLIDEKGSLALTDQNGATLTIDADAGEIIVADSNGNTMTMSSSGTTVEDSNGNKIEMAASGITVKGQQVVIDGQTVMLGGQGGEPIIKGQSFLSLFMTHMHPTAMGPSGPPIPQGEMSTLSTKVLTS